MNLSSLNADLDTTGNIALLHADVLEGLSRIEDETIDLVVTSPPYWTAVEYQGNDTLSSQTYEEYIAWLGSVWLDCFRALRPNGKLVINTPIMPIPNKVIKQRPRHIKNIFSDTEQWILSNTDYNRFSLYIWQKQTSKMMFGSYPFPPNILENNTIEFMAVYVKPGFPRKMSTATKNANHLKQYEWLDLTQQVWFMYPADVKRELHHPAPFPLKLPARFIKMYSFGASEDHDGDLILDPFNGIGTTSIVAKMLQRRCIGIELSHEYHRLAKNRVNSCIWGQGLNWLVGRPNYPTSEELSTYKCQKDYESSEKRFGDEADVDRALAKHKRTTYGRNIPSQSQTPLDLFDDKNNGE